MDKTVSLIAMGTGAETMTAEALRAVRGAGLILGASRLLVLLPPGCTENRLAEVRTAELADRIAQSEESRIAVLFSGDIGFYSGASLLARALRERKISFCSCPGVSTVQIMAARLGQPWQNWILVSAHGRDCSPVRSVMQGQPVFFLTGGPEGGAQICRCLTEAGLGELQVCVGQNLGASDERLVHGQARELAQAGLSPLAVLWVQAAPVPWREYGPFLPDEAFLRDRVPMTKQNVRAAILAQLHPASQDICWDVGSGTGSVSIALSRAAAQVYGVEDNEPACALSLRNREALGAWNLTILRGLAPEVLQGLPAPDKVFIGGSKGHLREILDTILAANPAARICVSAVTVETLSAAVSAMEERKLDPAAMQLAVTESSRRGSLHMMTAQNPVWLITGQRA